MFCKECGSLLKPIKQGEETVMGCSSCGVESSAGSIELKDTVEQDKLGKIDVVEEEKEAYPLIEFSGCSKCGHKMAYFWTVQTRASDEPETKFYKCEQCKTVTRDYS